MTQPMTTSITVHASNCWSSFTSMASTALQKLAAGVSKLWTMFKAGCSYLYASIAPLASKAMIWAKGNQQTAAIGAAIATVTAAVGVYLCCCRGTTTPTPPVPPVSA